MARYHKDLAEVAKLPNDVVLKIIELVNEDIDTDIDRIETAFYNIVLAKDDPESFVELIDDAPELTSKQKDILKDIMKKIHGKLDVRKMRTNSHVPRLKTFGHVYAQIGIYAITTEFRPLSDPDTKKITRLVPSLVIDTAFGDRHKRNKSINFQMDLDDAKLFVEALIKNIDALEDEIKEMREKFGESIV